MPDTEPEPQLIVDVVPRAGAWDAASLGPDAIARAARAAFAAADPALGEAEVAIVLTDDAEQRRLNAGFRGKDAATNVLSFPAGAAPHDPTQRSPLGDILLAYETIRREAEAENKDFEAHVAHLVIHGVLHLLGHDHEEDAAAVRMETMETELMTALGYADPHAHCEETAS
jgi:probable rRNA maturation factor